jgi:GntR family transcriptional regulator
VSSGGLRYQAIERALRDELDSLQPGDRLPSEADLARRFSVSRMTARRAVQRLEEAGLVHRVRGAGTFAARAPIHRQAGSLLSFSEEMRLRGMTPGSRLLEVGQRRPDPEESAALELDADARVVVVHRLRLADELPMAIERTTVHPGCAGVLGSDLETGSLHAAFEAHGRRPTAARGTLSSHLATDADAELLGVPAGSPLLVERRVVFDQDERPIERTETRYSPTRYVFEVELRRGSPIRPK